jgi:hypothetical protein
VCVYKGEMLANVIHGSGQLSKSNGDFYKGEFQNGQFSGVGEYLWLNKKHKYSG